MCQDKTLYVGIALDVLRRFKEHNATNKCRYTRSRKPLKLVYREECLDYHAAMIRELEIKSYGRKKKLELIGTDEDSSSQKARQESKRFFSTGKFLRSLIEYRKFGGVA